MRSTFEIEGITQHSGHKYNHFCAVKQNTNSEILPLFVRNEKSLQRYTLNSLTCIYQIWQNLEENCRHGKTWEIKLPINGSEHLKFIGLTVNTFSVLL